MYVYNNIWNIARIIQYTFGVLTFKNTFLEKCYCVKLNSTKAYMCRKHKLVRVHINMKKE